MSVEEYEMTVEEEKVWQFGEPDIRSMFSIIPLIMLNMSMKPPPIPIMPKGAKAPVCGLLHL